MKFSVIVPCYNQAQYLFGLLDNVASATTGEHEVIIINDGSTKPRTQELIDRLSPAGPHQTLVRIHQDNIGLASTRNVGLDHAQGEFIQFLDADDMLVSGKLDRQSALMDEYGLDIIIDEYMLGDNDLCTFVPSGDRLSSYDLTAASIAKTWERGMSIPIHCPLIRRKSLGRLRFAEDMRAKEDWIFWMSFFLEKRKYAFTGIVGAIYRDHGASMTRADKTGQAYQWMVATKEAAAKMPDAFDNEAEAMAIDRFNKFYLRFFYERDPNFNKNLFGPFLREITRQVEATGEN